MNNKIFVISHTSDIDGVGSASFLKMKYDMPLENIFFVEYTKESVEYAEKGIAGSYKNAITLFITDVGVSDINAVQFKRIIANVKKNGGKVFWFDHHVWSTTSVKEIASKCDMAVVGENPRYCAAEITRLMLGFNDDFCKEFANVVHCSDFNLTPKNKEIGKKVGTYALSIAYYNTLKREKTYAALRHIIDVISKKRFSDAKIEKDAEYFNKLNEDRIKIILKSLYLGDEIAVGFAKDKVQATWTCNKIMKKSRKDIAVLVDIFNGRVHLRSKKADISLIANKFGGGGHPHAGGFAINVRKYGGFKSEKQKQDFVDKINRITK